MLRLPAPAFAATPSVVMLVLAHGWAPGEFSHPEGLALGGGRLFVADKDNNRIVALQPDTFAWLFEVGSFGSGIRIES